MALVPIRIGVPTVSLAVPANVSLGSLAGVTLSASTMTPGLIGLYSAKNPLSAGVNYQFVIGMVGRQSNGLGGYSVSPCTSATSNAQVTGNGFQGIRISATNTALTTAAPNIANCYCLAVFGNAGGSSLWQLYEFAYYDTSGHDFNHMVVSSPIPASPTFSLAVLQSTAADPNGILGDRTPYGVTYTSIPVTTGGVQVNRDVSSVNVSPDSSPDYAIATSRAASIQFNSLSNGILQIVQAATGTIAQFTPSDNPVATIQVAQQTLLTAQAILKGNNGIILNMPPDNTGVGEIRLYLGNLTLTQTAINENWQKAATTPIQFKLDTAAQDNLVTNQMSEIIFKRYGG